MNKPTPSHPKTFVANLHPAAARFNLKPHLSTVSLANILAGDTCAPISLTDFEKYLTFVEYSVENLQFLVWFQDYRERYLKFSRKLSAPERDTFTSQTPSHAQTERRETESLAKLGDSGIEISEEVPPKTPSTAATLVSPSPLLPPHYTPPAWPASTYAVPKTKDADGHPFRTECSRVVATFLTPGASKELPLDATIRDTAIRTLSIDCHPDAFLPVYEETYHVLEHCSIPRFLAAASANINLPKQIYWYIVGTLNIAIGILIALLLIMMVPTPPEANRAYRIFPVGFVALGAAQIYSAWRGYCSQVWLRGATQLRVWEMQETDTETQAFVSRILGPHTVHVPLPPDSQDGSPSIQEKTLDSVQEKTPSREVDIATIAPFTMEPPPGRASHSSDTIPSFGLKSTEHVHKFHRPPIWGPETVVLDPHIKAVHRQVLMDTCRVGTWFLLGFSALVFSVPSLSHS